MRQLFCFIVTKVLNYVTFSAYRSNSESPFTPHASKNRHSIEENCERNIIMVIICNFILLLFWSSHISSVFLIYLTSIFLIKRTGLPAATATGGTSLVTTLPVISLFNYNYYFFYKENSFLKKSFCCIAQNYILPLNSFFRQINRFLRYD